MKDLNLYAKELVDVVNYLMKKNQLVFSRNNKLIYVNTDTIKSMLEKRNYDTVDGKLYLWRELEWIECADERFNKRITLNGENMYVVSIKYKSFSILKSIYL
ncbi:hypothetical protein [Clostridium perfringens]|uniref:TcpK family conjugal transfer DNA-binding protein n=1 Tax=Clostridium perfringens TaxID=1502 RepID=UPI0024BCD614|nr:hypothetical protein [Clostridium perfringens]MDU7067202.1 hypothetical protein [Clostridium perfringens]